MNSQFSQIKNFAPQKYSKEEQNKIFDYFEELKADYIRSFLASKGLRKSGAKNDLIVNITEYVEKGQIAYTDLVNFLDEVTPYGKQHVFLYSGSDREVSNWKKEHYCIKILEENKKIQFLNKKLHLILPENLSLSSIEYDPGKELKILAVQRRDYIDRCAEFDTPVDKNGIELHAYKHQVIRGLIIFQWNLLTNLARLQITQLPSRGSYEDAEKNFIELTQPWLPYNTFNKMDIRPSITRLRGMEVPEGTPEARSSDFSLDTVEGRRLSLKSPSNQDSTAGEEILDEIIQQAGSIGVAHLGNFYWLPKESNPIPGNILENEVHTIIVGNKSRINFTKPNRKEDFEYVLSRVRALCD